MSSTDANDKIKEKEQTTKIPKFYTVNHDRFINPAYLIKNVSQMEIDNWPAHSSGRLHPTTQIMVNNVHRVKVLNEHESKLPNLVPKPRFLDFLEQHVNKELQEHKVTKVEPNTLRLQIYGEAFEWLLQALKSYRPLLASVKREYEMNIEFLRSELRKVEPMKELLWTLSQEYDQRVMMSRKKESIEIKQLKSEIRKTHQELSDLMAEKDTLKTQVTKLSEELEQQSYYCRTEADARKILITDMNDLRSKLKEMERLIKNPEEDENRENSVKLRWAYEQAKVALTEAQRRLVVMEATHSEVVPKTQFDELYLKFINIQEEFKTLQVEKYNLFNEHNNLQNQYNGMYLQRFFLHNQVTMLREKLVGPTPLTKTERTALEKSYQRVQALKENPDEDLKRWINYSHELTDDEMLNKIQEELSKTDGTAEVTMELLMYPELQVLFNQSYHNNDSPSISNQENSR